MYFTSRGNSLFIIRYYLAYGYHMRFKFHIILIFITCIVIKNLINLTKLWAQRVGDKLSLIKKISWDNSFFLFIFLYFFICNFENLSKFAICDIGGLAFISDRTIVIWNIFFIIYFSLTSSQNLKIFSLVNTLINIANFI